MRWLVPFFVLGSSAFVASCGKNMEPFEGVFVLESDSSVFVRFYPGDLAITNANPARRAELFHIVRTDGDIYLDPAAGVEGSLESFEITKTSTGIHLSEKYAKPVVDWIFVSEEKGKPNQRLEDNAGLPPPSSGRSPALAPRRPGVSQP